MMRMLLVLVVCFALVSNAFTWLSGARSPYNFRHGMMTMSDDGATSTGGDVFHQVFVGNLPFSFNEYQLIDLVKEKNPPGFQSLRIAIDKKSGRSRGFGYINFVAKEDAEAAVQLLNGVQIEGRELKIDVAGPRTEKPREPNQRTERRGGVPEHSVFVGNIDFNVLESDVAGICEDLLGPGVVKKIRIATDRETGEDLLFLVYYFALLVLVN
jgi:RNA recognition motif. (a.k.a. RRM, RBD, or RNP domain)